MTDFERLLSVLTGADVEFIVIGGFAATAHGSAYLTVVDAQIGLQRPQRPRQPGDVVGCASVDDAAPPGLPF